MAKPGKLAKKNLKLTMMKEEKQRLVLNKRTVAHLNNLEMKHVRGGDGDEGTPTRKGCGDVDNKDPIKVLDELLIKFVTFASGTC